MLLLHKENRNFVIFPTDLQPSKNIEEDVPNTSQALGPGVVIRVNSGDQRVDREDGKCTLPEAILSANQSLSKIPVVSGECLNGQGSDTIIFDDVSTVTLTTPYESDPTYGPLGLPLITGTVIISGGIEGIVIKQTFDVIEPSHILHVEGSSGRLTLENITLDGGNLITQERSLDMYELGSGIALFNQAVLTLTNNSLITGTRGGGIYATQKSRVSLIDSMISSGTGTGIKVEDHSHLKLFRSTVENMVSIEGGGLSVSRYSAAELIDSYVMRNIAGSGAGIDSDHLSDVAVKNSAIISNIVKGGVGGGIAIGPSGVPDEELDHRGHVTIENTQIAYNKCEKASPHRPGDGPDRNGRGSGLVVYGKVTIINSQITYNNCRYASGIFFKSGNLIVKNSQIIQNIGDLNIVVYSNANVRILDNTYISENQGGIWNMGHMAIIDSHILSNTGGIASQGDISICNSSIIGNTSGRGAGVGISGLPHTISVARLINSRLSHNRIIDPITEVYLYGIGTGGGIYSENALVTIRNSKITYNSATDNENSTVVRTKGGAISAMEGSQIWISHSDISHNNASSQGGGIFVADGGSVILNESQLRYNQAQGGGAIQNIDGQVVMSDNIIIGNSNIAITGNSSITATHNWWGQTDGPSGAGPGHGDSVGEGVDFSNFHTQPIAIDEVEFPCIEEEKVFLPWVERSE